jgi:hypothetical protein
VALKALSIAVEEIKLDTAKKKTKKKSNKVFFKIK